MVVHQAVRGTHAEIELTPRVGDLLLSTLELASAETPPRELVELYIGHVEAELGPDAHRPHLADRRRRAPRRREADPRTALSDPQYTGLVKEVFNFYFRDDVYGDLRDDATIILSSGSADEELYGLPESLKVSMRDAVDRDLYGYSDSRGRLSAREAVAAYENARIIGEPYTQENVAVTLGGTAAISSLADLVRLRGTVLVGPALCAVPNYPPLVTAVHRRMPLELVPMTCRDYGTDISALIARLTPVTPLVLLQTVTNPTGTRVSEEQLAELVDAAGPDTLIVLDECHECLGDEWMHDAARAAANVVRVSSLSKTFAAPGLKVGWMLAHPSLIDEFYEYASTTYGGPPSYLYLLLELTARFERWRLAGVSRVGEGELHELEMASRPTLSRLRKRFATYVQDRAEREERLLALREHAYRSLVDLRLQPLRASHSFNLAFSLGGAEPYTTFRRLLARQRLSLLPGDLTFATGGGWLRLTTARHPRELQAGLEALAAALR